MDKVLVDIRKETDTIKEFFEGKDTVPVDDLLNAIDNLIYEKHCLEEKLQDQKEYCDEWHTTRKVDYYEEYGVSERDFV